MYTQSHKYYLACVCRQLFQTMLSQTSLSAFSVSDFTLVLMIAVLLGRRYQHCHTELSPVTLVLLIEFSSSVALLWHRCPLAGWGSYPFGSGPASDLTWLGCPRGSQSSLAVTILQQGDTQIQALFFATSTTVWVVRSTWSGQPNVVTDRVLSEVLQQNPVYTFQIVMAHQLL